MPSLKEIRVYQRRLAADGFDASVIAARIMERFGCRARAAWRLTHGWSQLEAAELYNSQYGTATRAPMSASRLGAYERWPDTGERPSADMIDRLAALYGARAVDLLDDLDLDRLSAIDRPAYDALIRQNPTRLNSQPHPSVEYRRNRDTLGDDDGVSSDGIEEVLMAAAREGGDHAEQVERRDVGDATLEQLYAEVVRLSQAYVDGEPLPVFLEMMRLRRRIWEVSERRLWPKDQADLHFLLGALHVLMAAASNGLGQRQAAEMLIRTGWAYASTIGHNPLMAQLRLEQSAIVYWDRPRQSRDLARAGLRYLSRGPHAADLHVRYARAAGRLGDVEAAREAISSAGEIHDSDYHDDVLAIGGEFGLSRATLHGHAGSALVMIREPEAQHEAVAELTQAVDLYAAGPEPGEQHYWGSEASARIDLATAQLRTGDLDAATEALQPVLGLPPSKRINSVLERLQRLRPELATRRYRGNNQATGLDEEIEAFSLDTIVHDAAGWPAN